MGPAAGIKKASFDAQIYSREPHNSESFGHNFFNIAATIYIRGSRSAINQSRGARISDYITGSEPQPNPFFVLINGRKEVW